MSQLTKIRLSNCRKVKPFWADLSDINAAFRDLNNFIARYYHKRDRIEINSNRHNLIFFHQLPCYKVDGHAILDHNKKDKRPRYKGSKQIRQRYHRYRSKKIPKRYVTNTKVNYWATYGIHPIPLPKIIASEYKHKDPSGINSIKKDQIEKLFIENCFGIFYTNSVNYAKMNGWDIRFHIDCLMEDQTREYMMNVSPTDILRITYQYYKYGIHKISTDKKIMRHIANVTYGWLKPVLPMAMSYLESTRDFEFGKFIIRCERDDTEYWVEIPLMVENQYNQLIDSLKTFISETGIDTDTKIEITFKSDIVYHESNNQ